MFVFGALDKQAASCTIVPMCTPDRKFSLGSKHQFRNNEWVNFTLPGVLITNNQGKLHYVTDARQTKKKKKKKEERSRQIVVLKFHQVEGITEYLVKFQAFSDRDTRNTDVRPISRQRHYQL